MSTREVFDPGLQPERTALSWRRAGLSLGGAALLLARVLAESSVASALVVAAVGIALTIITLAAGERRYRSHHDRLLTTRDGSADAATARVPLAGGGLPLFLALTTVVLGSGGAVAVIQLALRLK